MARPDCSVNAPELVAIENGGKCAVPIGIPHERRCPFARSAELKVYFPVKHGLLARCGDGQGDRWRKL